MGGAANPGRQRAAGQPVRIRRSRAREQPAARTGALGDDRGGDPPAVGAEARLGVRARRTTQRSRAATWSSATEESLRLNALQDAANEEASELDERAAGYTAILAMLAVAIYLFGLTLAVRQRSFRAGFLGIGLGMLAIALLWMAQTAIIPPYDTDDEAAAEYAKGKRRRGQRPSTRQASPPRRTTTTARSSCALHSPSAYAERAGVIFSAASPQRSGLHQHRAARSSGPSRGGSAIRRSPSGWRMRRPWDHSASISSPRGSSRPIWTSSTSRSTTPSGRSCSIRPSPSTATTSASRWPQPDVSTTLAARTRTRCWRRSTSIPGRACCATEPFIEESWLAGALTDLEIVRRHQAELRAGHGTAGFRGPAARAEGADRGPRGRRDSRRTSRFAGRLREHRAAGLPGRAPVAGQRPELRRRPATRSPPSGTTTTPREVAGR